MPLAASNGPKLGAAACRSRDRQRGVRSGDLLAQIFGGLESPKAGLQSDLRRLLPIDTVTGMAVGGFMNVEG
jgi:hypothetical protein